MHDLARSRSCRQGYVRFPTFAHACAAAQSSWPTYREGSSSAAMTRTRRVADLPKYTRTHRRALRSATDTRLHPTTTRMLKPRRCTSRQNYQQAVSNSGPQQWLSGIVVSAFTNGTTAQMLSYRSDSKDRQRRCVAWPRYDLEVV
eukprot:2465347-Pleurochrysis_carterae.AAC.1